MSILIWIDLVSMKHQPPLHVLSLKKIWRDSLTTLALTYIVSNLWANKETTSLEWGALIAVFVLVCPFICPHLQIMSPFPQFHLWNSGQRFSFFFLLFLLSSIFSYVPLPTSPLPFNLLPRTKIFYTSS